MKRRAIIAIILSVAICTAFCIPVYARPIDDQYIPVCGAYPFAEDLPYGTETVVLSYTHFISNVTVMWFFFRKLPSSPSEGGNTLQNFTVYPYKQTVTGTVRNFIEFISAGPIIWVHTDQHGDLVREEIGQFDTSLGAWHYVLDTNYFDGNHPSMWCCTVPPYYHGLGKMPSGVDTWSWDIKPYMTRDNYHLDNFAEQGNSEVQSQIAAGNSQILNQIQEGNSEIQSQIQQGFSEINSAGDEEPTLDSDTSWMDEALDSVNGWIDSVDDFSESLESAGEDVADYIDSGTTLFSRFLDTCEDYAPGLYAIIIFVFIWVVVRKIIGR